MRKLKIAILADDGVIPRFCLNALDRLTNCDEIAIFSCTNSRSRKRIFRHAFYYALNLVTIRNLLTTLVPVASGKRRVARRHEFEAGSERGWQVLPADVQEEMRAGGFDAILKFGMGLLRIPEDPSFPPILSYHHGDPACYRGRPAGFWEMFDGAPVVGQIVQILNNRVDGGRIVAFGETKIHRHSYRATLLEAYHHSPILLGEAIERTLQGRSIERDSNGRLCRLPTNFGVTRFVARLFLRKVKRWLYGALVEKRWRVSLANGDDMKTLDIVRSGELPAAASWQTVPVTKDYTFYADPFFSFDPPGLLVEGLNRRTGLGEILLIDATGQKRVSTTRRHFAYPCTTRVNGRQLIVPEIAEWSPPKTFSLEEGRLHEVGELRLATAGTIIDPTLFERDGHFYLFGNLLSIGPGALFLWSASALDDTFRLHSQGSILVSPRGARMAGNLLSVDGRIIRFGQNFVAEYGNGIFAFEVEELTPHSYRETLLSEIRHEDRFGPHTLNIMDGSIVFDWFQNKFSPLAGVRRLLARGKRVQYPLEVSMDEVGECAAQAFA